MSSRTLMRRVSYLALCLAYVLCCSTPLAAQEAPGLTEEDRAQLNEPFYSEVVASSCAGPQLSGNNNEERVWNYLVGNMRFTAVQAAGSMGNLRHEGNFNPRIVEGGTWGGQDWPPEMDTIPPPVGPRGQPGYGIVQWTSPNRKQGLQNIANERGLPVYDLGLQLEYMRSELEGPYRQAALDPLTRATDLAEATRIWQDHYEVGANFTPRFEAAQDYMASFGSNTAAATGGTGCPGQGVSPDGFVFPLRTTKDAILGMSTAWCSTSQTNCHHDYEAADIFAPTGTEVLAARGGEVVLANDNDSASVGSRVVIRADDGNIYYYAHMGDGTITVSEGDTITAGTVLGRVGTSADAMGTLEHLHIDALPGNEYDTRPSCSGAACSSESFLNLQPALVAAFNALE